MLQFVNAHRLASVSVLVATVLVVVTLSGAVGGQTEDASEGNPFDPTPSRDSVVPPETTNASTGAEQAAPPTEPNSNDRVAMPVNPSGSRSDRSEAGARRAAIDFAGTVQQRLVYLTDDAARTLLTSWIASSADRDTLDQDIQDLATFRSALVSGGGDVWWSVTPIAWKVEAFDDDRARVAVWVSQVVGSNVNPTLGGEAIAPTVDFRTTTVDLVWDDRAGWSVWATGSTPGPAPMMATTSTMSAPTEFMDALGSFTLVKDHS